MARDLRLFYLFRLLSTSYLYVPIWLLFGKARGLAIEELFGLVSVFSLVVIVAEVPTGLLADRAGRRTAMMAGALSNVGASLIYYFAGGFWPFAGATVLASLSLTLCSGADSAYLFDLLNGNGRGDEYARREGTASAWHLFGNSVAFLAGGFLFGMNEGLPFLANAGVASAAFVVAILMRKDRMAAQAPMVPRGYMHDMRRSLSLAVRRRALRWVIVYSAAVFLLLRGQEKLYQLYLPANGFSPEHLGSIFAGMYLVAGFVAHHLDVLRHKLREATLVWGLLGVLGVSFLALGFLSGPAVLAVVAVQAAAMGLYSPLVKPLLNREIEDSSLRATVLSVESVVRRLAFAGFAPILGAVIGAYGPAMGMTVSGGVAFFALLILSGTRPRPARISLPAAHRSVAGPAAQPATAAEEQR